VQADYAADLRLLGLEGQRARQTGNGGNSEWQSRGVIHWLLAQLR
jgi:hypothetical protein